MLELHDLHVMYGQVAALKGVSLRVEQGEIVVLIGANGAGKSTTLRAISGVVPGSGGEIRLAGEVINGWPAHRRVAQGLIHVPEGRQVFPQMSVQENLRLGGYLCPDQTELRRRAEAVLALFPILERRRNQPAGTLSGGEQQMLAIGRGLMAGPRVLMLDEPSLGLAPVLVEEIFDVLVKLNHQGTTILLVEQNANMALSIAHRAYVLEAGYLVMEGDAAVLQSDDSVRRAYLGH